MSWVDPTCAYTIRSFNRSNPPASTNIDQRSPNQYLTLNTATNPPTFVMAPLATDATAQAKQQWQFRPSTNSGVDITGFTIHCVSTGLTQCLDRMSDSSASAADAGKMVMAPVDKNRMTQSWFFETGAPGVVNKRIAVKGGARPVQGGQDDDGPMLRTQWVQLDVTKQGDRAVGILTGSFLGPTEATRWDVTFVKAMP